MAHKVIVDQSACIAQGDCEELAPDVFLVQGNVSTVVGHAPLNQLLIAARACPTEAITVVDEESGEQLYP